MNNLHLKNEEHHEAYQAEVNKRKENLRNQMTEEEKIKFDTIENCIKQLSDAKVPFLFFANPHTKERNFFQFNRFTYDMNPFKEGRQEHIDNTNMIVRCMSDFVSQMGYFIGMLPPKI